MSETPSIQNIDFQQEQNKTLVVEAQHNLLKQENEKRWNSAENTWVDNTPLHPNDVHMIENIYKEQLGNITDEQKASDFLKPFFVARDMGFLDAMLYKQPFTVTDSAWNSRSLVFKEPLPYNELQSFVQSINSFQDWKTQFVDKVQEYVQGSLVVELLSIKKIESVKSTQSVEKNNTVQKVNSIYELQNIDSMQNWSIINIFNVEFTVNDSLKNYLKDSVAILKELGLESEINALLPWWITKEETMLIAQKVMKKLEWNTQVLFKIQKSYDALDQENKNKLNQISQMMKSDNKYWLTSKYWVEQAKKNVDFFAWREQQMIRDLSAELKKQEKTLPENVVNSLWSWLNARWAEQVTEQFNFLQSQSSEWLPKSKLIDMLNASPFDAVAMQKHGINHGVNDILKEITSDVNQPKIKDFSADQFHQLLTDYRTIKNTKSDADIKTLKQDNSPKSLDELIITINTNKNKVDQKTTQKALQSFVDTFESARSDSQTEAFMRSAMPAFEKAWVAIGQLSDGIQQLFDGLKKSGVWDEIAKIVDLLFGTWKLEDRLNRFNEIKETDMTLNQSWAMNTWFDLRKSNHEKHEKVPLETYAWTLKKDLPDVLFTDKTWEKELGKDSKEYQAFKWTFKEQTKWTAQSDPSLQDMIVRAHGTPTQRQSIYSGNPSSPDDIKWVVSGKVDTIYKRANDEKRDKTTNPNESFSRALLASLITPSKDSLRVARGVMKADKETNTTIESQKNAEINVFKNSLQIVQNNGKIKVETNPANENRKIHIDWKEVAYDKINGIAIQSWKPFSIINTDPKHKTTYWDENAIKVENIAVIDPQMKQEEGKIVLPWLVDAKNYTASVFDKDNNALLTDHALWSWQARELPIDKEKIPSYLLLKDDDNGIKQKIAFPPKQAQTEVKQ